MPTIILICGYRRTGKDTFCKSIIEGKSEYSWITFGTKSINTSIKYDHVAFANALKNEVHEIYGGEINEETKDVKQFLNNSASARDLYISHGTMRRAQDPNYWCKCALDKYIETETNLIITDFRFTNELNYVVNNFPNHEIITVRMYSTQVEKPDKNIESEHQLDYLLTDLLVLRNEGELDDALIEFLQYEFIN